MVSFASSFDQPAVARVCRRPGGDWHSSAFRREKLCRPWDPPAAMRHRRGIWLGRPTSKPQTLCLIFNTNACLLLQRGVAAGTQPKLPVPVAVIWWCGCPVGNARLRDQVSRR